MTAPRYQTSLPLATTDQATPEAAAIMQRTQEQLGFVPNMYRAMAQAPGLLETYADGYNRFRSTSRFSPVEQEVVFLAISRWNRCHYCVAAHSVVADLMSKVPTAVTDALRDGRPLPDGRLSALADFTTHLLETRGWPLAAAVETFVAAGYHEHHVLAIVHAIAVKTIQQLHEPHVPNRPRSHVRGPSMAAWCRTASVGHTSPGAASTVALGSRLT